MTRRNTKAIIASASVATRPVLSGLDLLDRLLAAAGLPVPLREYRFHPVRRWRFDLAWPAFWVAAEIEGGYATGGRHVRPKGFLGDLEKYTEAACLGWRILRLTPRQLARGELVDLLRRALQGAIDDGILRTGPDGGPDRPPCGRLSRHGACLD
jgi:hypothetical protein